MPIHVSSTIDTAYAKMLMLRHTPVGVALYDVQADMLLSANTRFIDFIQRLADHPLQPDDIIGHPYTHWLSHHFFENSQRALLHITTQTTSYIPPEQHIVTDGHSSYWDWTIQPLYDPQQTVTHALATLTDITQHVLKRQQSEQRQESLAQACIQIEEERKYLEIISTIAQSVQGALHLVEVGQTATRTIYQHITANWVALYVANDQQPHLSCLDRYPAPPAESRQTDLLTVSYHSRELLAQASNQREAIIFEDIRQAEPACPSAQHFALPSHFVSYIYIPLWFKDHFEGLLSASFAHPIQRDNAEVQTLIGSATHIAAALAHARLQTLIEAEHKHLHTILDQIPDSILLVDAPDGKISYVNHAANQLSSGYLQQHLGTSFQQAHANLMQRGNAPPHANITYTIMRALQGETVYRQEHTIPQLDGIHTFQIGSAVPIRNEENEISGAIAIFQDITDLKNIERQKQAFLSLVSHELRTPVTAIQGFAEILHMQLEHGYALDNHRSQRAIQGIIEYCQHLTYLIEEMLDLTHLEKAQLAIEMSKQDLHALLRHVVETHQIISARQLRIHLDSLEADEPLLAIFDAYRIMQVLNNLISNAIRYSPKECEIIIGLRHLPAPDNAALLWIKDEGVGIPEQDLSHLFERFHPNNVVDRSRSSGLGIGLYLVKELVTRHGGSIWAESTQDKGSTFYVRLPLTQQAPP